MCSVAWATAAGSIVSSRRFLVALTFAALLFTSPSAAAQSLPSLETLEDGFANGALNDNYRPYSCRRDSIS